MLDPLIEFAKGQFEFLNNHKVDLIVKITKAFFLFFSGQYNLDDQSTAFEKFQDLDIISTVGELAETLIKGESDKLANVQRGIKCVSVVLFAGYDILQSQGQSITTRDLLEKYRYYIENLFNEVFDFIKYQLIKDDRLTDLITGL